MTTHDDTTETTETTEPRYLFVYGTLMSGECRERAMVDTGAVLVGARETRPEFALFDLGPFPGMIRGTDVVRGELWEVTPATVRRCDLIEGHPSHYRRTPVVLADGTEAQTYVLPRGRASWSEERRIESGDWRDAPGSEAAERRGEEVA